MQRTSNFSLDLRGKSQTLHGVIIAKIDVAVLQIQRSAMKAGRMTSLQ